MIKIAPSLLASDFSNLREEVATISNADMLHLDVMDGHFVPNMSFGAQLIKAIRKYSDLIFDVHLMISHPIKYLDDFAKAGADIITFHVECEDNIKEVINKIKSHNIKCGIVLSPDTDVEASKEYIDDVDMVLLMSVYPGFGGQKFMPSTLDKVRKLKELIGDRDVLIEIDGGISEENIHLVKEAGVDVAVAGTSVFGKENREKAIEDLKK